MWEYKSIKLSVDSSFYGVRMFDVSAMKREFNSLGENDWELISFIDMNGIPFKIFYGHI
jgi:hypothetical protein